MIYFIQSATMKLDKKFKNYKINQSLTCFRFPESELNYNFHFWISNQAWPISKFQVRKLPK